MFHSLMWHQNPECSGSCQKLLGALPWCPETGRGLHGGGGRHSSQQRNQGEQECPWRKWKETGWKQCVWGKLFLVFSCLYTHQIFHCASELKDIFKISWDMFAELPQIHFEFFCLYHFNIILINLHLFLLRYNWHTTLLSFQVYNIMIRCVYVGIPHFFKGSHYSTFMKKNLHKYLFSLTERNLKRIFTFTKNGKKQN